jgi:2-dehydropantoate 2-reductase
MKTAVIGAGAMGCLYGSSLKKSGAEVWLYDVWQEHIDKINRDGLIISDGKYSKKININATTNIEEISNADLIIIFTKSMHTENAILKALKIMNTNTVVLTLQNGLGNIEIISKYINKENIIAGITTYASDLKGPGEIEAKGSGITKIMPLGTASREVAEVLFKLLNESGINTEISNDVMIDIWEKVAFNAALNTLTALTFLTVGQLGETPEGFELAKTISSEVVKVANAKGIKANEKKVHQIIEDVFDPEMSGDHKPSMLQDRLFKRKTEIESICGQVLLEAEKYNIKVDHIETVYKLIKTIEKNYDNQLI